MWFDGSPTSADRCQRWSSGYHPSVNKESWEHRCGDGLKVSEEQWEDNNTVSGDGCSPTWTIETNYACDGGNSNDAFDKWTYWNNSEGLYLNDINNPTQWIPQWGDSKRAGDEVCDDNNNASGDGWSSDCSVIEDNYIWSGGSPTSIDQCQEWTSGYYPNDAKDSWEKGVEMV